MDELKKLIREIPGLSKAGHSFLRSDHAAQGQTGFHLMVTASAITIRPQSGCRRWHRSTRIYLRAGAGLSLGRGICARAQTEEASGQTAHVSYASSNTEPTRSRFIEDAILPGADGADQRRSSGHRRHGCRHCGIGASNLAGRVAGAAFAVELELSEWTRQAARSGRLLADPIRLLKRAQARNDLRHARSRADILLFRGSVWRLWRGALAHNLE